MQRFADNLDKPGIRKTGLVLGILFALGCGAAAADTFEGLDRNDDGMLDQSEYQGYMNQPGAFNDWDSNSDALIDSDEFELLDEEYVAVHEFVDWDINGDGEIDPGEFTESSFSAYDVNNDGIWGDGGWNDASKAGLFASLTSTDETIRSERES